MPVRGSNPVEEAEKRKESILQKIKAVNVKPHIHYDNNIENQDENSCQENDEDIRKNSIKGYKAMIDETLDLPLEKLVLTPEGCEIFDILCLRLDINQKYVDLLPQWRDVAHILQLDDLATKWVEVCVRPREGLTRAMLEIYMRDGGTLGEVFEALLELECLDILEDAKPKVDLYIKKKEAGDLVAMTNFANCDNFFSVIKTLALALGNKDPCRDVHKYANGLKNTKITEVSSDACEVREHSGLVKSVAEVLSNDWPRYTSELHLNKLEMEEMPKKQRLICKILLIFADDGVADSQNAIDISKTMQNEECSVELIRLNEATLWYEVLVNPEACCMKWASEADYIMPILTPKFLREIHGQITGDSESLGLLPTSPILNKYMYNLARSQYTQNGCKNLKVRPLIPLHCLTKVKNSNAVKMDPLLAHTWKALREDLVKSRFKSMMAECVKRR